MGYYSEVGLALTHNGVNELHKRLELIKSDSDVVREVMTLLEYANQHYTDKETNAEVWFWEFRKWYTGDPKYYPEIDFIDNFLDSLNEDDFRFIRIGEEYDDTEVLGGFVENPFDLELAREITIRAA